MRAHALALRRADVVADAAHGVDEAVAELAAQLMHVDRDRVALEFLAPAVQAILELRARQDRAGTQHQGFEHRVLARRQRDRHAALRHLAGGRVEGHVADREGRRGAARLAAHDRAHAREQFVELERLDDVVVGAGVESAHAARQGVARRDDDDRRAVAARAHRLQHRDAVALRQAEVEQDEVEALGREGVLGGAAIAHPVDGEAGLAQRLAQAFADHAVVFGEQQAHTNVGRRSKSAVCRRRIRRRLGRRGRGRHGRDPRPRVHNGRFP